MAKRWGWTLAEMRTLGLSDRRVWTAYTILFDRSRRLHYMRLIT